VADDRKVIYRDTSHVFIGPYVDDIVKVVAQISVLTDIDRTLAHWHWRKGMFDGK
jgi:hypothetical protein